MRKLRIHLQHVPVQILKYAWRGAGRFGRAVMVIRLFSVLALAFGLMALGRYFEVGLVAMDLSLDLDRVGSYLLVTFAGLVVVKLFVAGHALPLDPYRYLPVSPSGVAACSHVMCFVDTSNVLFLSFLVPFWHASIVPRAEFAGAWLGGMVAILIIVHFGTFSMRLLQDRWPRWFWSVLGVSMAAILIDTAGGFAGVPRAWTALTSALASGYAASAALMAVAAMVFGMATRLLAREIQWPRGTSVRRAPTQSACGTTAGPARLGPLRRLVEFEAMLILRNRFPRYVMKSVGFMAILLLPFPFIMPEEAYNFTGIYLIMVVFGLSYGLYAFAWNSEHFNGLFNLPISTSDHVLARLVITTCLFTCVLPFAFAIVFLSKVTPSYHVLSMYVFAIGCTICSFVSVSMVATRRLEVNGSPFANMQAQRWHHVLMTFGSFIGLEALVRLTSAHTAAVVLGVMGAAGVLALPIQVRWTARLLDRSIVDLSRRFRASKG